MRAEVREGSDGRRFLTDQGYATSAGLYSYYFATRNDILPGRPLPDGEAGPEKIDWLEGVRDARGSGTQDLSQGGGVEHAVAPDFNFLKGGPEICVITSLDPPPMAAPDQPFVKGIQGRRFH